MYVEKERTPTNGHHLPSLREKAKIVLEDPTTDKEGHRESQFALQPLLDVADARSLLVGQQLVEYIVLTKGIHRNQCRSVQWQD